MKVKKWSETNSESAHGSLSFLHLATGCRVARWYIFNPEIFIWVHLGGGHAMEDIGIFYGPMGLFTVI
jgi:hypothetical protein